MALNIKDPDADRLAAEVAALTGESKARAVKVALQERRDRLALQGTGREPRQRLQRLLEEEVWPLVPADELGRPLSKAEREGILGLGPEGH